MYRCSSEKQVQREKHCGSWVNGYRRRCLGLSCIIFKSTFTASKGKFEAIPLQAWTGPEGSGRLEASRF
jgi:hypothetical protein